MDELLRRAIAGVMWGAQEGRLPLMSWTLGLPQEELMDLVATYFPELQPLEPMTVTEYATLQASVPDEFEDMVEYLMLNAPLKETDPSVRWFARALAAACFGNRHLWEDLELDGRESVSKLLKCYFEPLYRRNTENLRWKNFLFRELGTFKGIQNMQPSGCSHCESFKDCFPLTLTEERP